jgi:HTH-type transcriptional regulator / antitoxin HipB
MKHTSASIGIFIRQTRKRQGLTQQDVALTCGTGQRFISELENGKPGCHFAKTLNVLQTLGITVELISPYGDKL